MSVLNALWAAAIVIAGLATSPYSVKVEAASEIVPAATELTVQQASALARLALECLTREFPNKPVLEKHGR